MAGAGGRTAGRRDSQQPRGQPAGTSKDGIDDGAMALTAEGRKSGDLELCNSCCRIMLCFARAGADRLGVACWAGIMMIMEEVKGR